MEEENKDDIQSVLISPEMAVAKFCTHSALEAFSEHSVFLTLFHRMGNQSVVVARVAMDIEHLRNFTDSATKLLEEIERKKEEI